MATYAERCIARRTVLEAALERFVDMCRARPDVVAVMVFGSLGSGRVGPRSDLDFLVVRETTIRGIERAADLAVAADLGVEHDLIVVTPTELRDALPTTSFGRTLLQTARTVYAA